MRHYIGSFAWILLLAASTGCQRVIESDVLESVERPQMTISATLEGGDGTRTVLGNPGNSLYRSYWKDSDEIAIYADGAEHVERFVLQSGAGTGEATFSGPQSSGALVGLYPFSSIVDETLSEDYVLTLELPEIQHYAKDSFGDGAYPMLAVSYSSQLVFKNLCALLQLSITGSYPIEAITFRAHDSAMSVSGKATVRTVYDYVPDMVMREGGSPEVTLQCDGVELDASTPTLFFLVIPPGTYKDGFEIEIISKAGKMVRSTQDDISFSRSQYRTIPSFAFVPEVESVAVPEPIDLGLPSGLKWASFNLGAAKPEEHGDYYAWGETEPYYSSLNPLIWKPNKESGYIYDSYKWCMGDYKTMTKYCTNSEYGYNGFTDGKTVLDFEDDAAHISLGGNWRMPTKEEFDELLENCSWTWTSLDGVYGLQITSAVPGFANQSIFLPAAGYMNGLDLSDVNSYGSYWLSSLTEDHQYQAYQVGFYSSSLSCFANPRCLGFSIRPVYDDGTVTKVATITPTNIGPCSVEIPFTISTNEVVNNFGIVYSTNINEPVVGNYGDGAYSAYYSSEGNSMIISELKPNTTYYARAFITLNEEHGTKIYGNTIQFTTKEILYSSDYVDIGLSVAWATCNLGSSTPSNVGGYYRWGETDLSSLSTGYIWSGSDGFTKYNATDGKVTLEASDDAASVNLGGKWRMPTNDELTELRNNCTWTPTTQNGVKGSTVIGPNGKSIFIPISKGTSGAFTAEFLSSSLSTYSNDAYRYVHALSYHYDNNSVYFLRTFRDWGTPIRPVYDNSEEPEPLSFIRYTSSDGNIVSPYNSDAFTARIISNEYINGQGIITFDGSIKEIGENAFRDCTSLTSIEIPSSVTSIGDAAFMNTSITSFVVPDSVKSIGAATFWNCPYLTSFEIPSNVMTIGEMAFACCSGLRQFKGKFTSPDGRCLITDDGVLFAFAQSGVSTYTISNNVNRIGNGAFYNCMNLRSVDIPDGVSSVGELAFAYSAISSVTLSSSVKSIEYAAFAGCFRLESIMIPESVTSIGMGAFQNCHFMSRVECRPALPPTGGEDMFDKSSDYPIYVPSGSVGRYISAQYWCDYTERIKPAEGGSDTEPEGVDLGLSVKWASCNLGASKPEEYGDYYAWGETEPYYSNQNPLTWKEGKESGYAWSSYKWCFGSEETMTKYCSFSPFGYNKFTDTKTVLDPEDDVAHVKLGGKWRMPTDAEFTELRDRCTWEWTSMNGINGRKVTGPNGNSIFLPSAGNGYGTKVGIGGSNGLYWSSSLETGLPCYAWCIDFDSDIVYRRSDDRYVGRSVRPVTD